MPLLQHRPRSFQKLIWIGFLCVTLPLALVLVNAGVFAGRFARRAAEAVQQAARVADDSRLLHDQVVSLERRARQLYVLGDQQLFRDYEDRRGAFHETLERLSQALPGAGARERLRAMRELEAGVYRFLTGGPHAKGAEVEALDRFVQLNGLARETLDESTRLSLEEAQALEGEAEGARLTLLWQASALVPVTILVSALFASLLGRPIRQIHRGIQDLGEGNFAHPIAVRGPKDLEFLGERLDWLRLRLAELEAEKARFLSHMSHELKTPLTAIREGAELLGEGVVGALSPEQREVAGILRGNAVRLQHLIENLLRFNLEMARGEPSDEVWTDLSAVFETVLADHKPASVAKRLTLHKDLQPVTVRGDRERLRVILDNLVSNAVKFTPEGGSVFVRVFREGEKGMIEVRDTGPGVPIGERQRIFEPFFQGSARGGGPVQGSGLGLSIVAEYVDVLGGRVETVDPGAPGALFRVRLTARSEGGT